MPLLFVIPGVVVALVTLTASLAAVFRVGRLKSVAETAERAAEAWQEERNAAIAHNERQDEEHAQKIHQLETANSALEERVKELEAEAQRLREQTNLTRYFERQEQSHREVIDELHEVTAGVKTLATAMETLAVMLKPLTAAQ